MLRMRILHLVGRSQHRGAELVALQLAHDLSKLGHENEVLACAPGFDGRREPELPVLDDRQSMDAVALVPTAWRLRRHLGTAPVDALLAHGGWSVQVAALARPRRPPLLVWQRILPFGASVWQIGRRQWWRIVARRVDAAVELTPDMGRELRAIGYRGPAWPIANFRDPTRFVAVDRGAAAVSLRAELGCDHDAPLLGLVGHLIAQKRPERALDVLQTVRDSGVPAHLVVAGDGPLREELDAAVCERGLEPFVHRLGHRTDVERILGGIDLLLLTSDSEGIPGIVIEATMTGCPVVTYPLGAVATVIEDGCTGIVLPRADAALMASAVAELLRDPSTRARMSATGRDRADQYSSTRAAERYSSELEALVQTRTRRST
jgi:glycosyltransferase involved in cell wall biosynthesis